MPSISSFSIVQRIAPFRVQLEVWTLPTIGLIRYKMFSIRMAFWLWEFMPKGQAIDKLLIPSDRGSFPIKLQLQKQFREDFKATPVWSVYEPSVTFSVSIQFIFS